MKTFGITILRVFVLLYLKDTISSLVLILVTNPLSSVWIVILFTSLGVPLVNTFERSIVTGSGQRSIILSSSFLLLHDEKKDVAPITAAERSAIVIVFFIVPFCVIIL